MRRFRLTSLVVPESSVLKGCKEVLGYHRSVALWWRNQVGKGFVIRPRKLQSYTELGVQLKRCVEAGFLTKDQYQWLEWGEPGSSDLQGMLHGGRFFVNECKSTNGKVTDKQQEYLDRVSAGGGLAMCVNDAAKLNEALNSAYDR